jgi:hypothetical protein
LLVSIAPALPVEVFCSVMLGIPLSTFEEIIANGDGPRMFLIGRRRCITKQDGLDWIEELRESRPYVRSIRQRKAAASTPNATSEGGHVPSS